jgi:hypothetical protein
MVKPKVEASLFGEPDVDRGNVKEKSKMEAIVCP